MIKTQQKHQTKDCGYISQKNIIITGIQAYEDLTQENTKKKRATSKKANKSDFNATKVKKLHLESTISEKLVDYSKQSRKE